MTEDLGYKNAVVYDLDHETFIDASGDGVDTVWLTPSRPTPTRGNGHDVSDFYGVDPRHGSSGDFAAFMEQAKRCGIHALKGYDYRRFRVGDLTYTPGGSSP